MRWRKLQNEGKIWVSTGCPIKRGWRQPKETGKAERMWGVGEKTQKNGKAGTWGGGTASGKFLDVVWPHLSIGMVNDQNKVSLCCALMKHTVSFQDDPSSSVKVYSHHALLWISRQNLWYRHYIAHLDQPRTHRWKWKRLEMEKINGEFIRFNKLE